MAANTLKSIGKFSVDVIHSLIKKKPFSEKTMKELEALEEDLVKPEKTVKSTRGENFSDQELFRTQIEPAIRQAAAEFDAKGKCYYKRLKIRNFFKPTCAYCTLKATPAK